MSGSKKLLSSEEKKARKKARNRRYYDTNKEKLRIARQERYENDPEYQLIRNRAWRDANPEKYAEAIRKWKQSHRAQVYESARQSRLSNPKRTIINRLRARAKLIGIPFDLNEHDLVFPEVCPALGIPIDQTDRYSDGYPHIDRVIPEKGYVLGNIAVISSRANRLKQNGSAEEHRRIADYIERHVNGFGKD